MTLKWVIRESSHCDPEVPLLISHIANILSLSECEVTTTALKRFIAGLLVTKQYQNWNEHSLRRVQFKYLVLEAGQHCSQFAESILEITLSLIQLGNDYTTRFDALETLFHLVREVKNFAQFSQMLIDICVKGMTWKVGKATESIRRAGALTLSQALTSQSVSIESVLDNLTTLMPVVKGCVEEEWSLQLRIVALNLLKILFAELKEKICQETLFKTYPLLLSRLDDSEDSIRIISVDVLGQLIACPAFEFSNSTHEYIVKVLFLHMDDHNQQLRERVFWLLSFLKESKCPEVVTTFAQENLTKYKHKQLCAQLINENK